MAAAQSTISEFYYACRNNNINLVRSLVESMTPDQIDKVERNDEIVELFLRKNTDDKLVGDLRDELEWIEVGEKIDQKAKSIRQMLETYSNRERKKKKKKKILIEMIELGDYYNITKIKWHFDQAYTEETEFYTRLNKSLAKVDELDPDDESQRQLLGFLNLICCHPNFRKYDY